MDCDKTRRAIENTKAMLKTRTSGECFSLFSTFSLFPTFLFFSFLYDKEVMWHVFPMVFTLTDEAWVFDQSERAPGPIYVI